MAYFYTYFIRTVHLKKMISIHTAPGDFLYINIITYVLYATYFLAAGLCVFVGSAIIVSNGMISVYDRLTPPTNFKIGTRPSYYYHLSEVSSL